MKHAWLPQSDEGNRTVDWCCITGCLRIRGTDRNGRKYGKIHKPSPVVRPEILESLKRKKLLDRMSRESR